MNSQTSLAQSRKRLLSTIDSPHDLRRLDPALLPQLATELRETIISTVAKTGGHLAPCLGVVELTLALHYIFNTPTDKIIWDVGHQCYAHKLLTGRRDRFDSLRRFGGISGFPKRAESEYDPFDTGHSSTSISAALGMATGAALNGENNKTIAVIGDGSMTGGLAFEGLNQAGHLGKNLIVILNDNEMSISPSVGALSSFISRKLTGRTVARIKKNMEHFLKNFQLGENFFHLLKRSEESLKGFFTPGMLFEAFKFDYVGPIPGHDLESLLATLRNVRDFSEGPMLVHVITTKGKGYAPAEQCPDNFHGVGPFVVADGCEVKTPTGGPASYTKIFGDTLVELAQEDPRICAITAAMPIGTGLGPFAEKFPDRFFDVGIAEQHATTFAAGLACEGLRPVIGIYSTFLQRAFDQVIHDVCLPDLPVVFAIDRGGVVGDDGPTHHGVFDLAFLRIIPNLVLMAPKDENELRHLLYTAFKYSGPVAIRYPRGLGLGVEIDRQWQKIPIGQAELLREGEDILLLPVGNRVYPALEAADSLAGMGIRAAVINPRFIKPLDEELITHWAGRTGRVVTVEDNVRTGGFGSAVLELLQRWGLAAIRVKNLGLPDRFLEQGSQPQLWQIGKIDAAAISAAALELR